MIVGLIGAGRIGGVHCGTLAGLDAVDRILVTDPLPDRALALAAGHDRTEVATDDHIFGAADAVVIASSTDTHAHFLEQAAAAGLPTFCEKPIALDLESTRRAIAAVEAAGVTVLMGFQRRYDPAMGTIADQVASGAMGTPYLIRSQTHDPEPPPMDYIPVSGGIFKDCLVHDIDIVRYVSGQEVVSVRVAGAVLGFPEIGELGDIDSATVIAELSGGTLAQLSGLRHDPLGYDVRLEVYGSANSASAGIGSRTPMMAAESSSTPVHRITGWLERFGEAYRIEMEAFLRVAAGSDVPASTPTDALEALRVATACDLSLAEDRTVYLEEIG